jgi:5'-deoxynucleotidase YfbR-like HD superfamily hydrolase
MPDPVPFDLRRLGREAWNRDGYRPGTSVQKKALRLSWPSWTIAPVRRREPDNAMIVGW